MPITRTTFEIRAADGTPPIRGDLRVRQGHEPTAAVVICHGFKGFRAWGFFPEVAKAAAERGYAAVTFDFSHNGVGDDGIDFSALGRFAVQTHTRNLAEIGKVLDALAGGVLLPRAPRAIGLLGHSRGGGEAILAAADDERVRALVTWAAISDIPSRWTEEQVQAWSRGETIHVQNARTGQQMPIRPAYWADVRDNRERLDIGAAAARVAVPWLIVHGDADTSVPLADGHALFDAAGENAELLVVEGGDHTFNARHPYDGATPELRTVTDATLEWFDAQLG